MRPIVALTIMLVVSFPSVLLAHEGHAHKVMGTVVAVDAEQGRLEVKTQDGKSVALVVDQKTKYVRGKEPAAPKDVAQGSRVVVTTVEESGVTRALEVRLPERKSQSPKTGTSPEK
jgi:hypothetical protein